MTYDEWWIFEPPMRWRREHSDDKIVATPCFCTNPRPRVAGLISTDSDRSGQWTRLDLDLDVHAGNWPTREPLLSLSYDPGATALPHAWRSGDAQVDGHDRVLRCRHGIRLDSGRTIVRTSVGSAEVNIVT